MRAVQLDEVEADARRAPGGVDEAIPDPRQPLAIELQRHRPAFAEGERRGRDGLPAAPFRQQRLAARRRHGHRRLAAGMADLDAELRLRERADDVHHPLQRRFLPVIVQGKAVAATVAGRLDGVGFDDDEARPRHRQAAEMLDVPVLRPAPVGGVLRHRRHHDLVGQPQRPEGGLAEQRRLGRRRRLRRRTDCRHLGSSCRNGQLGLSCRWHAERCMSPTGRSLGSSIRQRSKA